jgi:flavin reductase (DIM6/NTAB) family NADH-FMN oxidoreductase RutF
MSANNATEAAGNKTATVPMTLTEALELGPDTLTPREFYLLLTALVVPRPIGWISTVSASGVRNVAPYSYFNLMGSEPFYCAFGSTGEKDTLKNIREVPQFVANIVTMDLLEKMNMTSGDYPRDQDEFDWAGLTPVPSMKVKPDRVGEAKAHLECEVKHIYDDDRTHIVIAKIVHVHVSPSVWKNGRVDPKLLDPVGRLSGSLYAPLGDIFSVPRPDAAQISGTPSPDKMPKATRR